jgi:hypothetical protein
MQCIKMKKLIWKIRVSLLQTVVHVSALTECTGHFTVVMRNSRAGIFQVGSRRLYYGSVEIKLYC